MGGQITSLEEQVKSMRTRLEALEVLTNGHQLKLGGLILHDEANGAAVTRLDKEVASLQTKLTDLASAIKAVEVAAKLHQKLLETAGTKQLTLEEKAATLAAKTQVDELNQKITDLLRSFET